MQATHFELAIAVGSQLLALLREHVATCVKALVLHVHNTHYGTLRIISWFGEVCMNRISLFSATTSASSHSINFT